MRATSPMRLYGKILGLAAAVALIFGAVAFSGNDALAASRDAIKRIVVEEALKTTVPPSLALAVARNESNFKAKALSSAGARGVMQIMPKTGRDLYGVHPDELWKPRLNVKLGIDFLEKLIKRYGGRWDLALSHYNGGSRVGKPPFAKVIPATRKYVNAVLRTQRKYERNATVIAMTEEIRKHGAATVQLASASGRRSPAYWMFDDPTIEKNWRHYLKVADHWLARPTDSAHEEPDNPYAEPPVETAEAKPAKPAAVEGPAYWDSDTATAEYTPRGGAHELSSRIETSRARFRAHLTGGGLPWKSRRGHLSGGGAPTAPWATGKS